MNQDQQPYQQRYYRGPAVDAIRQRKKSSRAMDVRAGLLPTPIKPARKVALWVAHEIDQIVAAEAAGATPDQIKALVKRLEGQRAADLNSLLSV